MKKRLEKAIPIKSNLTLKEQTFFILKTFELLKNVKNIDLEFRNIKYKGIQNKDYGFFIEDENIKESIKMNPIPKAVITSETFLEILPKLDTLKFNRLFNIKILKNESILIDPLLKTEDKFKNIIYFSEEISIRINSKFLYIFRLNNKTFLKKSYIYIYDKHLWIELKRKNKKMLFYMKLN